MTDESRLEQGRRVTRKLFGEKRAQIVEDAVGNMSPDFAKFVMEGFGIYENPQLDMKTRSTITIAILTALGRSQELVLHVRGGINNGLTEEEIRAIIAQVALYAGVPVAIEAFLVAGKMFDKIKEKGND